MACVDFHFQQVQVFVTVAAVFFRGADPLEQGFRAGLEPGGNDDTGEIVQHPGKKGVENVIAENFGVNGNFGIQVEHIENFNILDAVGERLKSLEILLVFRIRDGHEKRVDAFLDVLDLVDPFADDVVQFDRTIRVV